MPTISSIHIDMEWEAGRTWGPPAGKDARFLTSSVLFLTISLVASVRLCLEVSWASGRGLISGQGRMGDKARRMARTDLSVKLVHLLVLPIYRLAFEYPVHLTES
jgi:hypothetical protein